MDLNFWLLYVSVVFMASIIPGPSMLLALTHGIKYGYKRSISTALGNTTASIIQVIIAISGLSIVFTTSGMLFLIIKYLGALYLIYIGIMLFRTPTENLLNNENITNNSSLFNLFSQAFLIAIGNPKAIIFFTALFPQFISKDGAPLLQYIIMTITLGVIAFIAMMIYSIAGDRATNFIKNSFIRRALNRITGGIFISAGCGLALKN